MLATQLMVCLVIAEEDGDGDQIGSLDLQIRGACVNV